MCFSKTGLHGLTSALVSLGTLFCLFFKKHVSFTALFSVS